MGKVRASYMQAGFDIYSEDNHLLYGNTSLKMVSLEGEYHWDNWTAHAGLASGTAYSHPDEYLGYFSLGYRFDRFLPYALYSRKAMYFESLAFFGEGDEGLLTEGAVSNRSARISSAVSPPPPPLPPPPPEPSDDERDGKRVENTFAVGMRYDLTPQLAVKLQWDYLEEHDQSLIGQPDKKKRFNIYTFVIEGVF